MLSLLPWCPRRTVPFIFCQITGTALWPNSFFFEKKWSYPLLWLYKLFFEIEQEDGDKKYGTSKEHRPDPIIQMWLSADRGGILLSSHSFQTAAISRRLWNLWKRRSCKNSGMTILFTAQRKQIFQHALSMYSTKTRPPHISLHFS